MPLTGLASGFQGAAIFQPETASYLFLVNNDPGALYQAERPWGPWKKVAELFHPGVELEGWNGSWGPLMSLIPMETSLDSVQFTNAADEHYALTIGTLRLVP